MSEDIEVDLYPEASRLAVETRGQVVPSRDGAVVLDLVLGLPLDDLDDSAGMTVRWGERMRVALSPDSMREILTAYGSTGPQAIEMLAEAIQHGTRVSSDRLENAVEHLTPLLRQGRLALEDDPSPVNERGFIAARSALQDVALTGGGPGPIQGSGSVGDRRPRSYLAHPGGTRRGSRRGRPVLAVPTQRRHVAAARYREPVGALSLSGEWRQDGRHGRRGRLRARRVAAAASAWMREPHDARVYGRLVEAIEAWDSYVSPQLEDGGEVLDELAETNPPQPLASGVADLEALLRGAARRAL